MSIQIRLMGPPEIRDGAGCSHPVRGHQAWALLARVLLSTRPLSRRTLAAELFPDAVDPLGALRWTLAALRKAIGTPACLLGDPVEAALPAGACVDVLELGLGSDRVDLEAAGPLLEGIEPQCGPEFATWLLVERECMASLLGARLRDKVQEAIAQGSVEAAIRLAQRAVRHAPLDEGTHVLLVKSLVAAGHFETAERHVAATRRQFVEQLGRSPSAALGSAARRTVSSSPQGVAATAVIKSLLESGVAALSAGAAETGIDHLRRAATDAEVCADPALQARTLLELGSALVHSVRGYDEEGAVLLRRSAMLAQSVGDGSTAVVACRELGYVDALAGRRPSAAAHLARALQAATKPDELSGVHGVIAFNLVDWGRTQEGLAQFEKSLEYARIAGNRRRRAWSLGLGSWGLLALDRVEAARRWLDECLQVLEELRWNSFRPWPVALMAECRIRLREDSAAVEEDLQRAFAMSCQLADPCWEAAASRGLALCKEAAGDLEGAAQWLAEGRSRCSRESDTYAALLVQILCDQARIDASLGRTRQAAARAREALALAARAHMNAHVRRAAQLLGIELA